MNTRRRFQNKYGLRDRFNLCIKKTNYCWEWIGSISGNGYGQITYNKKHYLAHRLAFLFLVGELNSGMVIDHICHNARCVNPDHLRQITQPENMQNQLEQKNKTSIYRGVSFDKTRNKWKAYVKVNKKIIYLGRYIDEKIANEVAKAGRLKFLPYSTI